MINLMKSEKIYNILASLYPIVFFIFIFFSENRKVTCKQILKQSQIEAPSRETCPHIQSITLLHPISSSKGKSIESIANSHLIQISHVPLVISQCASNYI